jgi:prepilin-type N-terminal cleavage/methylation domain-containing protein
MNDICKIKNMYIKNKQAFTFVELIVVITILAILATIWFWTYQSYLSWWRDTNRIVQLKDIHDWFERYSINSRLPLPESMIEIQLSGDTFAYQWYAGDSVIKTIGYDWWWQDPEFGTYLTYMLTESGRDFQLLSYINDPSLLSQEIIKSTYANSDYELLYPKVIWSPLWIMMGFSSQIPLQNIEDIKNAWLYDISSWSEDLKAYYTDKKYINSQIEDITQIIPNQSCRRILELGVSKWSGEYIISPSGLSRINVYCDMETDGWWWTYVAHSSDEPSSSDFWWLHSTWKYNKYSQPYSLGSQVKNIYFEEILFQTYTWNGESEASWKQTLIDRSVVQDEISSSSSLEQVCEVFELAEWWSNPPCFRFWGEVDNANGFAFNRWWDSWLNGVERDGLTSNGWIPNEMRWDQARFFIR